MCDLKSSFPPVTIAPGLILVTSITLGSYHNMKSQLFIPLDGTPVMYTGISTVSPTFAFTLATVTTVPSPDGGIVGFGVSVGSSICISGLIRPGTILTGIKFKL